MAHNVVFKRKKNIDQKDAETLTGEQQMLFFFLIFKKELSVTFR